MTKEQLQSRLVEVEAAYVERTGKRPFLGGYLTLHQSGQWAAMFWTEASDELRGRGDTPEAAIDDLAAQIAKLPTGEAANLAEFQRKLAELIDLGNKHQIDAKWLNPITETARDLATNALTHEADQ